MLTKIVELPSQFATGESTVQLVATYGRNSKILREQTSLHRATKLASESPALDMIRSIEPQPGRTVMLIIGLGDHETYGPNRRGDSFPSEPIPGRIQPGETLKDWYHTYDTANVFRHHINHDPAGAIGKVIKAFWNPFMHRVEVIQYINHDQAPDILEKLMGGVPLATSMGCHVPYDVCTTCGNRAVSRAEYCMHLLQHMGEINPDGTQNAALNPNPKFFDSSMVTRPADRNGFVLRKVADANTGRTYELWSPSRIGGADLAKIAEGLRQKAAALNKLSDIEKTIAGTIEASSSGTPEGTITLVRQYADHAMPEGGLGCQNADFSVDRTSQDQGASVKVASLGGLLNYAMRLEGVTPTAPMLRSSLAHAGDVQAIFAAYPRFHSDVCKLGNIRDDITDRYHQAEVAAAPYVDVSNVLGSGQTAMRPLTDKLTYTDPHGNTYETTVGLANRARNFDTVANQTRPLQIGLSAVGLGNIFGNAGHSALLHRPSKELMTNEGEKILSNTEMVRTASAPEEPRIRGRHVHMTMYDEVQDFSSSKGQRKGASMHFTSFVDAPAERGPLWNGSSMPSRLPKSAADPSIPIEMAAVDFRRRDGRPMKLASDVREQLWAAIRSAEVVDDLSDALGPTLDLSKVASALGKSILDAVA